MVETPRSPRLRIDLGRALAPGTRVEIELGCGEGKKPGRIGVDVRDLPAVDVVADLNLGLPFLPDRSVDAIHAHHVFEHIDAFEALLADCLRVLRDDGRLHVEVPHFTNPLAFSDYTHRRFFGLYTFQYFVPPHLQRSRKVPSYRPDLALRILSERLVFRGGSGKPGILHRAVDRLVNSSARMQELYEERFAYWVPCYEIRLALTPHREG